MWRFYIVPGAVVLFRVNYIQLDCARGVVHPLLWHKPHPTTGCLCHTSVSHRVRGPSRCSQVRGWDGEIPSERNRILERKSRDFSLNDSVTGEGHNDVLKSLYIFICTRHLVNPNTFVTQCPSCSLRLFRLRGVGHPSPHLRRTYPVLPVSTSSSPYIKSFGTSTLRSYFGTVLTLHRKGG